MILEETYILSNGIEIPKLGLGTWFIDNDDAAQAVTDATAIGTATSTLHRLTATKRVSVRGSDPVVCQETRCSSRRSSPPT